MLCHMTGRLTAGYVEIRKTVKSDKCSNEIFKKEVYHEQYCLFCVRDATLCGGEDLILSNFLIMKTQLF